MLKDLLRYKGSAIRVGAAMLGAFLLFLGVAYMINRTFTLTFWDKGYELKADFVDADGIANASDVRIAGSYVGQITDIRATQGGLAEITIRMDSKHSPLTAGTKASVRLATLLGTKYVEVLPGPSNGERLKSGTVIPTTQTQSPVDFDQFLQSFDAPTREAVQQIVKELGVTVDGRGDDVSALLAALHSLSVNSVPDLEAVSDRSGNLDQIVSGLDDVGGNLAAQRDHLAGVFTHLNDVLATIAVNDTAFRRLLSAGNESLGHGLQQFQGEAGNINATIQNLRPAADQLGPVFSDINSYAQRIDGLTKFGDLLSSDIFSAVSDYNHNPANGNQGGFYLRQPSVLAPAGTFDQEKNGAQPPGGPAAPSTRGGVLNLPGLQLPGNLLPGIPGLTRSSSSTAPSDAEIELWRWLLG